jgi:1-deoxy-D-xylulose-5-phosphate reductoisomerase
LILLGSTGSIGVNTLEIAKKFALNVEVLVAGRNIDLLNSQIKEHNPKKEKEKVKRRCNYTS